MTDLELMKSNPQNLYEVEFNKQDSTLVFIPVAPDYSKCLNTSRKAYEVLEDAFEVASFNILSGKEEVPYILDCPVVVTRDERVIVQLPEGILPNGVSPLSSVEYKYSKYLNGVVFK